MACRDDSPSNLSNSFLRGAFMKITKDLLDDIILDFQDGNLVKKLAEMPYKEFLKTIYWHEFKKIVHKFLGKECEVCGNKKHIHIHHFNYYNRGKETFNDIACLCEICHQAIHIHQNRILYPINNRVEFCRLLKRADKIKKNFCNKQYIKLLPLTKNVLWTVEQLSMLWDEDILDIEKALDFEVKRGLLTKSTFNDNEIYYSIASFVWYLIEFEYPKISC
jgi:hypothetical protein